MNALTHIERAQFLAAVQDLGQDEEIQEAARRLVLEIEAESPAPWAESDPFAAERYLASRGATPKAAASNAAEFELQSRALYALATGKLAQSFQDIANWFRTHVDGAE
ncbi:hypothetical protein [Streptomyces pacificus]|uniref:Uncharacterized protein n=1 Tax=Streptomyces pacificus TaxID=2705029 RepID=A0A6A0B504_9ACTN|nr:hypothetical protein [Streptomyces pacificus]GFH38877.1 hypothetical protein SCWH03_51400 [Streptomyces pacificus]